MSEVKLLVNKLPVTPSECPFFKVNYLYLDAKCAILDNVCELCHSSGCSKLMSYDEFLREQKEELEIKELAERCKRQQEIDKKLGTGPKVHVCFAKDYLLPEEKENQNEEDT